MPSRSGALLAHGDPRAFSMSARTTSAPPAARSSREEKSVWSASRACHAGALHVAHFHVRVREADQVACGQELLTEVPLHRDRFLE